MVIFTFKMKTETKNCLEQTSQKWYLWLTTSVGRGQSMGTWPLAFIHTRTLFLSLYINLIRNVYFCLTNKINENTADAILHSLSFTF